MNKKASNVISRRGFLGTSAAALAGLTIIPRHAVSGLGHIAPSDKLNIAGVGIGGMGRNNDLSTPTDISSFAFRYNRERKTDCRMAL